MISFRMPWFTLLAGAAVFFLACFLTLPKLVSLTCALAGCLLMLDGSLGLRVLPMLTPHASFPEDWHAIERRFYFERLGLIRWIAATISCLLFGFSMALVSEGDWQGWLLVAIIVLWGCGWVLAALRAIRDVLAND
jgi:hypothetical protein